MIKSFIFDMGGVLLGHTLSEYLMEFTQGDTNTYNFLKGIIGSPTWLELDAGLGIDEGIEKLCEETNHENDEIIEKLLHNFRMVEDPNPPMEELVKDIKEKGYDIFLMSNVSYNYKKFFPLIKSISYMNDIWVSCERKLMKPNEEAYKDLFTMFNLKPEECFFIDDSKSNIEAAQKCGMKGFVYKGNVDDLRKYIECYMKIAL